MSMPSPLNAATPLDDMPLETPATEDVALLMYTSGSVGAAEGGDPFPPNRCSPTDATRFVPTSSRSADRSLLVLPLYHINAECVTLMPTLLSGGSVVVPHRFNVSQFWDWLDEYRCTWSAVVPTIIAQLLDWKDPRAERREDRLPADPLHSFFFGAAVAFAAARVPGQIQAAADSGDGLERGREYFLQSAAAGRKQDRNARSGLGFRDQDRRPRGRRRAGGRARGSPAFAARP